MVGLVKLGVTHRTYTYTWVVGRFRSRLVEHPSAQTDWSVDGVPLRQLVVGDGQEPYDGVTPVENTAAGPDLAFEYLRTLLGTATTDAWTVPDGRVTLLCCPVDFDLDCGSLTTNLVCEEDHVIWRDVAFQTSYAPLDLEAQDGPIRSFQFDRQQYAHVIQALLAAELSCSD